MINNVISNVLKGYNDTKEDLQITKNLQNLGHL